MKKEFNPERIRIAQLRYFNAEIGASEIPKTKAYALMVEYQGNYINILNPFHEYPVYDRTVYPNQTKDGEYYGNKLLLVNGKEESGLCYILESKEVSKNLPAFHSISDIQEFVMTSPLFFIDRKDLILSKRDSKRYGRILSKDLEKEEAFLKEMNLQEKDTPYVKKNK